MNLKRFLAGEPKRITKCGGFACGKFFEVRGSVVPDIPICPTCAARINEGIVRNLHAHTGKIKGGFHATDGYSPH
jgi:hypothetical protein